MKSVRSFRIGSEKWAEFKRLAKRLKKKPTTLLRELVEDFVEKHKRGERKR